MRVGLFVTCLVDAMRPEIGFSTLKLLEAAGCEVVVPAAQTCCGQPGFNSGNMPATRALMEKFLDEFEGFEAVVIPSGSCAGMLKAHYTEVFVDDQERLARMEQLAARIYELSDFLHSVVKLTKLPAPAASTTGSITYHDSCSGLRELGIAAQPRALLAQTGRSLCEMQDSRACCGFGGTFALKYGEISAAITEEKCAQIRATGAEAVVLGDLGCMLNIEGRLRRSGDNTTRVLHVAQVLAGDA